MNRWIVMLAAVVTLGLMVETASAGHGRRVVRVHHRHAVVHVVPSHRVHHVPHVYHVPQTHHHSAFYPTYGSVVVRQHAYAPARIYVGTPIISLSIGY